MASRAKQYGFVGLLAALALGHGGYWFIGGAAAEHSTARNALVVGQIIISALVLGWAQLKIWRIKREAGEELPLHSESTV